MRDRLARVLARARELEGLGTVDTLANNHRRVRNYVPVKASALPEHFLLVRIRLSSR